MKNIKFKRADITKLHFPDNTFDKVVAANVIHLLDRPEEALNELKRVCKPGGQIIIPTYINKKAANKTGRYIKALNKLGVEFKNQFTFDEYKVFFAEKGIENAKFKLINGHVPCAVAIIKN